jgi:hypothetical protein
MSTPQNTTFPPQTQLPTMAAAAPSFTVGTVVESFNYRVFGGATGTGTRTTVTAADGSRTVTVVDGGGAALPPGTYTVIDASAPATVSAGATATIFDREVATWCDPTTGAGVAVVTLWNQTAAVGSAPLVEAYTLNGAPYVGAISALVKCAVTDVEVVVQEVCNGTLSFTRTTFLDAVTRVVQGTLWQDTTGAVIAAPTGPFTLGACGASVLTDVQLRATPVPVSGPLTDTQLRAAPVPVSGSVTTGGLTDTQLRAAAVPVSGPLTDTQMRAAAVPVSGPLTDTQMRAAAVPVSGPLTDVQMRAAAVPVSGPLTDTQLRAAAVPVSGPLTDTQLRATAVPVSGPLTDTQLRATAVPVSGPLTDVQLRATAVPVSVTSTVVYTAAAVATSTNGSVAAGAVSASFYNSGTLSATVAGGTLPANTGYDFAAPPQGTLGAIAYTAVGTTLLITTVR